jgi:alpha-1,6-mannosyltransferase
VRTVTRVAQLANFYSETSGGLRVAVDKFAEGYRAHGHSVTVVAPGGSTQVGPDRIAIAAPRLPNGSGYRVITSRLLLHRALEVAAPDLIEVHDKLLVPWAAGWARRRGIPVIAFSHERLDVTLAHFLPRIPTRVTHSLTRHVASRVAHHADLVVACSGFAAAEFGAHPKLRVVSLGVDLDFFHPEVRADDSSRPVRLICISRLSSEKRPDLAISALSEMLARGHSATLTIVGSGPLEKRLRTQADDLPVTFAGFLPRVEIARLLRAADVALVPGPAETFGLAALEALASGTPIVAAAGSGSAELVSGHPAAGLAATLTATDFADAACTLLGIPLATRRVMARRAATPRTWDRSIDQMLNIHAELIEHDRQLTALRAD